jgi:hypothetical protein|tara:strand:+ start:383 stop:754 length:372 start_codon:yes stop_codon:yes gene_type:complete
MKLAVIATATALLVANQASAEGSSSMGLDFGGEVETSMNVDSGIWALKVMPKVSMDVFGVDTSVTSNFDLLGFDGGSTVDVFQGVDVKGTYPLGFDGMSLFGKISSDGDLDFGDTTIGLTFAF